MALNLLYSNDRKGQYPASWYNATATEQKPYDALRGDIRADVCIVGAGYTGLSAALHLAEAGMEVALLDAHRVGFGASGRNGGQLGSGQRMDQEDLESFMGEAEALKLWRLGEEAKDLVKSLIARHDIDCHLKPGVAWTGSSCSEVSHLHDYARHLQDWYGYDQIEVLNDDACLKLCPSPDYKGGFLDHGAGHLHPLNYALGLARAAEAAGAKIYEQSEALEITEGAEDEHEDPQQPYGQAARSEKVRLASEPAVETTRVHPSDAARGEPSSGGTSRGSIPEPPRSLGERTRAKVSPAPSQALGQPVDAVRGAGVATVSF